MKLLNNRIKKCRGCNKDFCRKLDGSLPDPPLDMIIAHEERRPFSDSQNVKRLSRPQNVYYHSNSMFIHVRKDFATYHFFSSTLVGQRPQLTSLLAFGTDGELALENALEATFPKAVHVRCFLHFRKNIERKLRELNIPKPVALEIVKDIMGCPTQLQCGLVDSENVGEMDEMLGSKFETRWNEFEKPYYAWFMKHCHSNIAEYMLKNVRERAGLGCPPSPYYTNEVESKNRVLKEAVQYKSSQLPEFIEKMKGERAVVGAGEYRLREEYKRLAVNPSIATVHDSSDQLSSSDCPLDTLDIPQQLKENMWKKAQDLARDEEAIVKAPSEDHAWCIKSYSNKRPHYVKCGGFLCDDQCLSYKSMKLCSHTVALAIKMECMKTFIKWYRTLKCKPNFTTLVETGKPSTAGKKSIRRGVSKKNSKEIVANAEDSDLKWKTRGVEQSDDDADSLHSNQWWHTHHAGQSTTIDLSSINVLTFSKIATRTTLC